MEELVIDNVPKKITRYMICEMSTEIYSKNKYDDPKDHLYEGVVLQEDDCLDEEVLGVYTTEEEARKAFKKYETEIQTVSNAGRGGYRVFEYYLYERSFDLKEAVENARINDKKEIQKHLPGISTWNSCICRRLFLRCRCRFKHTYHQSKSLL